MSTSDPTISFRPIVDDDRPFLRELYASTRREEMAQTDWPQDQIEMFLSEQFHAQHMHYMQHFAKADFDLILRDGEPIGRLYLDEWEEEFRIIDIALLPEFRGRGIGGRILKDILEKAFAAGKAVGIHVEQNNPAMTLYQRLGFEMVEEQAVYHLMRANPPCPSSENAA